MTDRTPYDCVVIGAGPGGCSAAYHFQRTYPTGKVLWLDKEQFPREKICGDGWGGRTIGELKKLQVQWQQLTPQPEQIYALQLYLPGLGNFSVALPFPVTVCPRRIADDYLRTSVLAASKGSNGAIEWRPGCKATNYQHNPDGTITVRFLEATSHGTVVARSVIDAAGAASPIARILNPQKHPESQVAVSGRAYYRGLHLPHNALYICYFPKAEGYFWIFPTNRAEGGANVGLGMGAKDYKKAGKPLAYYWQQILELFPEVAALLAPAQQVSPFRGWLLYSQRGEAKVQDRNLFLVGESAGLVDPLGGAGIYYALRSGREAATIAARMVQSGDLTGNESYARWCAVKPIREFSKKDQALSRTSGLPEQKLRVRMQLFAGFSKVLFKVVNPLTPLPK